MKDYTKRYRIIRLTKNGGHSIYSVQKKWWIGWITKKEHPEDAGWAGEGDWKEKVRFSTKEKAKEYMDKLISNREYLYEDKINGKEVVVEEPNLMDELMEFING